MMATVTSEPAVRSEAAASADSVATRAPAPARLPVSPDRLFRITSATYYEMGRLGLISKADRLVLLDGFLVRKMTKKPKHVLVVQNVIDALNKPGVEGVYARLEQPITLDNGPGGSDSAPEPDIVLARGTKHDYGERHPGPKDIVLAVEVAESSLRDDRAALGRYAWFGVPCIWIVNLKNATIEVYDRPTDIGGEDARYGRSEIKRAGETIELLADDRVLAQISVSDIVA